VCIDPSSPGSEEIREAAGILEQQGVVIFPTTGLYGLGADAMATEAVERIFALKRRPIHNPLLVLLPGTELLETLVQIIPEYAEPLLGLWPGGITLVFKARDSVPATLTGGTGKIGVRLPAHPVARALVAEFGGPITGTSANLAGHPASARTTDIAAEIRDRVDMVLDAGMLVGGPGSTIVDVSVWPVKILREGAVPRATIEGILTWL